MRFPKPDAFRNASVLSNFQTWKNNGVFILFLNMHIFFLCIIIIPKCSHMHMCFSFACCSTQLLAIPELKSHFQGVSGLQQMLTTSHNSPIFTFPAFPPLFLPWGAQRKAFLCSRPAPIFPFSPTTPVKPERTGTKSAFYPDGTSSSGKSVPRKGSPCFASGDCLSQKSRNWEHRSSEAEAKIQPANSHPLLPGSRRDTPLPARRAAHLHPRKKPPVPPPDSTQDLCDSTRRALPSPSPQHGGLRMSTPPPQH